LAFHANLGDLRRPDFEAMLVCRREDRAILGFSNFSHITRGSLQNAYLGYAVGSTFAAQGYMREGTDLVLLEAFLTLRLHPDRGQNPARQSCLQRGRARATFSREGFAPRYLKISGRWRHPERWAILAEDWRAHRARLELSTDPDRSGW
jgi:ribosomal-protein-alanine N-acetyltransferase